MGKRLLVVCVDADDDLGRVGIHTPVVGEENVLKAAIRYALVRPEDADLNALFSALKVYRELKERGGYEVEVAAVSGDQSDEVVAGLRIREQVSEVLKGFDAEGIIVVSDGALDELVIPVINALRPVVSVKRAVVEQLRGVEETYVLILRYLRKILEEPRLSKIFLGVPGVLLVVLSVLALTNTLHWASIATAIIIGSTMLIKGFGLDRKVEEMWAKSPIVFASYIISLVSLALGCLTLTTSLHTTTSINRLIAEGLAILSPFLALSMISVFLGRAVVKVSDRDVGVWREAVALVFTALLLKVLYSISDALSSLPESPSASEVIMAISTAGVLDWLLITMSVTGLLTFMFTVMERRVRHED